MPHTRRMTRELQNCIKECLDCHSICLETSTHCLGLGGQHASAEHQGLLQDCAQICATAAGFMLRLSDHHERTCGLCAELCRACADSCDRIAGGDETMRRCAEICRRCAQSCESMAHAVA